MKKIVAYAQYLTPQHTISKLVGWLADLKTPWVKKRLIAYFIKKYQVDLQLAELTNADEYANFNDFFTRKIKADLRPIDADVSTIISPVDGLITACGHINKNQLLQAKHFYYDLDSLFAHDKSAQYFDEGEYATFYLSPKDYHRVHVPFAGKLIKTIYIPGKLFAVNQASIDTIPRVYTRNERIVCIFETAAGFMTIILVGAMIVGSLKMAWANDPITGSSIQTNHFTNQSFEKGAELGYFKMGSTVVLLFEKNKITWKQPLPIGEPIIYGQPIGAVSPPSTYPHD